MNQQARAVYMAEEFMAETNALSGTFDEARYVGQHKVNLIAAARLTNHHDAEIW
jgi:hypothetical protein